MSCISCKNNNLVFDGICQYCRLDPEIVISMNDIKKVYGLIYEQINKYSLFSFVCRGYGVYGRKYLISEIESLICKLVEDKVVKPHDCYLEIIKNKSKKQRITEIVMELLKKYELIDETLNTIPDIVNRFYKMEGVDEFSIGRKIVENINTINDTNVNRIKRKEIADNAINKHVTKNRPSNNDFINKTHSTIAYRKYIDGSIKLEEFMDTLNYYVDTIINKEDRRIKINSELTKNKISVDMVDRYRVYDNYVNKGDGTVATVLSSIKTIIETNKRDNDIKMLARDKRFPNYYDYDFYTNYIDGRISLTVASEQMDIEVNKYKKQQTIIEKRKKLQQFLKSMIAPSYIKDKVMLHPDCNKYLGTDTVKLSVLKKTLTNYMYHIIDGSPLGKNFGRFIGRFSICNPPLLGDTEEIDIEFAIFCNSDENKLVFDDYYDLEKKYIHNLCFSLGLQYICDNDEVNGTCIITITKPNDWTFNWAD